MTSAPFPDSLPETSIELLATSALGRTAQSVAVAIATIAMALALMHMFVAYFGTPETRMFRGVHLTGIMVLGILLRPTAGWITTRDQLKPAPLRAQMLGLAFDSLLLMVTIGFQIYCFWDVDSFLMRQGNPAHSDIVVGAFFAAALLEMTRRYVGPPMVILALFFCCHALYAPHFPGFLNGPPTSFRKLIDTLSIGQDGIFGAPLQVTASYVILFIIYGALLNKAGASRVFVDLASAVAGHLPGGPAKASVLGSALLGMVSGSAVANVVTTGTVSIPLMKTIGFKPKFAAAVEACASSGGQITPPIMGAAAFIMAEFTGLSYVTIVIAAVIPAMLYFATLYFMVDIEARRENLPLIDKTACPSAINVVKQGWLPLTSIIFLIGLLMYGYSPMYAAFWSIIGLVALSMVLVRPRLDIIDVMSAFEAGVRMCVSVSIACACAGIIIGAIFASGIGLKFTTSVIVLAGGNMFFLLCLTGLAGIVLGMGMTTTAVYVTLAALIVPALIAAGFTPLSAHFFALYYGVVSSITPPVALASFAAAGLAGSGFMETSFESARIGLAKYVVPFAFAFNPALLAQGSWIWIGISTVLAFAGLWSLSIFFTSWWRRKVPLFARIGFGLAGVALLLPPQAVILSNISGLKIAIIGAGILAGLTWFCSIKSHRVA